MNSRTAPDESRGNFIIGQSVFEPKDSMMVVEPSPAIERYVAFLQSVVQDDSSSEPTVEVNDAVGAFAFAYEKLRNSVEYREDSVLLRAAIKRILKRRLSPLWKYESTATALVRELIWARYLPNDTVPLSTVDQIEQLLVKYSTLRQAVIGRPQTDEWQDWILGIAACDIERLLKPRKTSYALAEIMFQWLQRNLIVEDLPEEEREVQLYLATHRVLLKSDKSLLTYHLFNILVENWQQAGEQEALLVARKLSDIRQSIDDHLQYPGSQALARLVKRHTPPFLVLDDIVRESPETALETLTRPEQAKKKIEHFCQQRYKDIGSRIRTAIIRSVIYIFITKVGMALILEVPFDNYFYGAIHWPQLIFNVGFPPLFMTVLGLSIATPGEKNTEAIGNQLMSIVAGKDAPERVSLKTKRSAVRSLLSWIFIGISLLTFSIVAAILWKFNFTWLGIGLFLFFFCVVVFFTYRVRQIAQEMRVVRQKENFLEGWVTVITLPFLTLGYRLSAEFGRVNVLTFVLDVLLEAPFKFILDMSENWLSFVRDKREEVIDRHEY